jgi:xanthine dehydrogenase/oxidase
MKCYEEYIKSLSFFYVRTRCCINFYLPVKCFRASPKDVKTYEVCGVCACEIELDVLTGQYLIKRVDLLEDAGTSMNANIDMGQVEGAFVMGMGYFTSEQIVIDENGQLLTNRTWNYKPPGARDIPVDFRIKFPKNTPNNGGVLNAKGE